jgi:hypothetical protein
VGNDANDIVRQAWRELPRGDRDLLREIRADQWEVCGRALGMYTDDLRVVLINESHPAFDGLDGSTFAYDLSRVAWHEWGHALSLDRAEEGDIAAGEHYVELLPKALAQLVRQAGYRRREYTHEVVAEIYAMPMTRRRQGTTGRPPWLDSEVYELVRRVAGWTQ